MTRGEREVGHGGVMYPSFDDPEPRQFSDAEKEEFQSVFGALGLSEVMTRVGDESDGNHD